MFDAYDDIDDFDDLFEPDEYQREHTCGHCGDACECDEGQAQASAPQQEEAPAPKPAVKRAVADVIAAVPGAQKVLMSTMEACREPLTPSELDDLMNQLMRCNRNVFRPVELRGLLEKYGAIAYTPSEEEEAAREAEEFRAAQREAGFEVEEEEPEYEVDAEGNLVIKKPAEGTWSLTEEGAAYLDSDPLGAYTSALLAKDAVYAPVYIELLSMLEREACSKRDLDAVIDKHPLVQKPRLYSGYFLSVLEKADAVEWRDAWYITERGLSVLDSLRAFENEMQLEEELACEGRA